MEKHHENKTQIEKWNPKRFYGKCEKRDIIFNLFDYVNDISSFTVD